MKILTIDIETRPSLAYIWEMWGDQHIGLDQLVESKEILCWSAKWHGAPKVHFESVHHNGSEAMIHDAWAFLDEADAVVHYNGKRFDVPHLNREFLSLGLRPPSPYRQVDLLEVAKKQFKFPSNKLAYVAEALGVGAKMRHEGFRLWLDCMAGDDAAWRKMRRYNIRDVIITERLYDRLLPWIPSHPSYGAMTGEDVCPSCGSTGIVRQGHAYTQTGRYQRYQCQECGRWSRGSKRDAGTNIVLAA